MTTIIEYIALGIFCLPTLAAVYIGVNQWIKEAQK